MRRRLIGDDGEGGKLDYEMVDADCKNLVGTDAAKTGLG